MNMNRILAEQIATQWNYTERSIIKEYRTTAVVTGFENWCRVEIFRDKESEVSPGLFLKIEKLASYATTYGVTGYVVIQDGACVGVMC